MPFTVEIGRKTVILNDKNKAVINAFNDALREQKIEKSQLPSGEKKVRNGFWNIVAKVEDLTHSNFSARDCDLERIEVQLDPPAKLLRDSYIEFLNALVKKDGVRSDEIAADKIEDHHVLIREILIRIATDALNENMLDDHDGDKLIEVLKSFIKNIKKQPALVMDGLLIKKLTNIARALVTSNDDWISCLSQMVSAIKLLHANKTVTSNALNLLEKTRLTIIRHLIAELTFEPTAGKTVRAERLHDDLATSTLIMLEDAMIEHRLKETKALIQVSAVSVHQRFQYVIECIRDDKDKVTPSSLKDNTSKRKNVKELYDFLRETNLRIDIVAQIDALNSTTGWVAIMTGAVRLDNLAKLLRAHADKCSLLLKVSQNAKALDGGKDITFGLVSYDATTGTALSRLAFTSASQFENLQKSETLNQLLGYIKHTVNRLIELQNQLPEAIELVDKQVCQQLITEYLPSRIEAISTSTSTTPALPPATRQDRRIELVEQPLNANQAGKKPALLPIIENNVKSFVSTLIEEDGQIEALLRRIPIGNLHDSYSAIYGRYRKVNAAIVLMTPAEFTPPSEVHQHADEAWLQQQREEGKGQQDSALQKYILDHIQFLASNDYDMDFCPLEDSIKFLDEKNYILILKKMNPALRENYAELLTQHVAYLKEKLATLELNSEKAKTNERRLGSETSVQKRFDEHIKLLGHLIDFVQKQIGLLRGAYRGSDSKIYSVDNCPQSELDKMINIRYMMRFAESLTQSKMLALYLNIIDRVSRECIDNPEVNLNRLLTERMTRAKEIPAHIKQCDATIMGILNSSHADDSVLKGKLKAYYVNRDSGPAPVAGQSVQLSQTQSFPPKSAPAKQPAKNAAAAPAPRP